LRYGIILAFIQKPKLIEGLSNIATSTRAGATLVKWLRE
jgi:hypothetical protein